MTQLARGLYAKLVASMDFNLIYDSAVNNFVPVNHLAESQTSSRGGELQGKNLTSPPIRMLFELVQNYTAYLVPLSHTLPA